MTQWNEQLAGSRNSFSVALIALLLSGSLWAQDPPLPAGLEPPLNEPELPSGLSVEPSLPDGLTSPSLAQPDIEPALPSGLAGEETDTDQVFTDGGEHSGLPFEINGFIESRLGARTGEDSTQRNTSIGEIRTQLQMEQDWDVARLAITVDLLYDNVARTQKVELDTGNGWLDLRQANFLFRPTDNADLEIGRQVLTWGAGDLLFINDLFPKDWNSFFIGRQDEYLKAPSDAAKLALFNDLANIDLVYTPRFASDRYIDGTRVSFYNPQLGRITGRDNPVNVNSHNRWFTDDEFALRAYRNLGSWEGALYGYSGYWKSPGGLDPVTGLATFPRLDAFGASLRGPLASGIAAIEAGYYDSRDDSGGDNPLVNNSEFRLLAGYEQEILPQLTLGLQYYLEWLQDYDAYRRTLPAGFEPRDERRHVFTTRLTRLAMNQNLMLSLFNYYSPSDDDGYLRLNANYKLTDQWQIESGANLFYGEREHTFFGQFENNSNLYLGLRFSF